MKIKDMPCFERPREKLAKYGPNKLSNAELLAVILGTGKKGQNAIQLSERIIKKCLWKELLSINFKELKEMSVLGFVKTCKIIAVIEIGKRLFNSKKATFFMSASNVFEEMKDLRSKKKEYFVVFFLDVQNQVTKREIISVGILNTSLVHPREIFEPAIINMAAQIIISHNHPSGNSRPSDEDVRITKRLTEAGKILGIEIIDHVIVADNEFTSLKAIKVF